ncbi:MAG: YbaB/EbfC family nucleoid-associated protein [Candidatus Berkelbacteria bacterium]|nr:YbaB/EbfC family nucleoid-associated protein [Candidatus Berkelbacteria bacterium]
MANMFGKMGEMLKLQREAKRIQKELRNTEVESVSGGGKIKVILSGEVQVVKIDIDEDVLKPENKTEIEDSLINTINAGVKKAQAEAAEKSKGMLSKLNLPM